MKWRIYIYETKNKQWAWRLRAPNNKVVADSAEQYVRRYGVLRAVQPLAEKLEAEVWESFRNGAKSRRIDNGVNVVPMKAARRLGELAERHQPPPAVAHGTPPTRAADC